MINSRRRLRKNFQTPEKFNNESNRSLFTREGFNDSMKESAFLDSLIKKERTKMDEFKKIKLGDDKGFLFLRKKKKRDSSKQSEGLDDDFNPRDPGSKSKNMNMVRQPISLS